MRSAESSLQEANAFPLLLPTPNHYRGSYTFLDNFSGTQVCSKLIYAEALNHAFDEPKQWEIREINEIMNNSIEGWKPFSNPRIFAKYGRQRGWERTPPPGNGLSATGSNSLDGFQELTEEELSQMELPF